MDMGFGQGEEEYADMYLVTLDAVKMTTTTVCSLHDNDGYIISL